jgi:hypothetical protein
VKRISPEGGVTELQGFIAATVLRQQKCILPGVLDPSPIKSIRPALAADFCSAVRFHKAIEIRPRDTDAAPLRLLFVLMPDLRCAPVFAHIHGSSLHVERIPAPPTSEQLSQRQSAPIKARVLQLQQVAQLRPEHWQALRTKIIRCTICATPRHSPSSAVSPSLIPV